MSPYLPLFIAFSLTNFRKFSKFGVLCPAIFFEKFPKISRKFPEIFSTFSKSKKTAIFTPKIVHNHCMNQNFAKFSLKTQKIANFKNKLMVDLATGFEKSFHYLFPVHLSRRTNYCSDVNLWIQTGRGQLCPLMHG